MIPIELLRRRWTRRGTLRVTLLLALGAGCSASAVDAATVLRKALSFEIGTDGSVLENTSIRARIDSPADAEVWSLYPIPLDANRKLTSFEATIVHANGRRERVGRKQQDRVEYSRGSTLYGSASFHMVKLEGLSPGDVLEIEHSVVEEPYYPAHSMLLANTDPIDELEVEVRGDGLRWRLDGPVGPDAYQVIESPGGLTVRATAIDRLEPPPLAAAEGTAQPMLYFAWDDGGDWAAVGRWYTDLLRDVPTASPAIDQLARQLSDGVSGRRAQLEAYLAYLHQKVRYVAVEVGIGGYRPSLPSEVAERRWGDCKDKAMLLIALLERSGIRAYPALALLHSTARVDAEFASPMQFNHLIVAVPQAEVEVTDDDPVSGGYLFVDPTQDGGTARYLQPAAQGQHTLVVTEAGGQLVLTPLHAQDESVTVAVEVQVADDGSASGRADLYFTGAQGSALIGQLASAPSERQMERGLDLFGRLLPAVQVLSMGYETVPGDIPTAHFAATVALKHLVDFAATRPALRLPALVTSPEPREIDEVKGTLALRAEVGSTTWRLRFPDNGCGPKLDEISIDNKIGSFRQTVSREPDGAYRIERATGIERRWIEAEDVAPLKELALAEFRTARRRIPLVCGSGDASPDAE